MGALLREWRERRRLSQLELSLQAEVSTRHLSFVETGRSRPTADMIERLAGQLDVPLRERNRLLLAGGYAPAHPEHELDEPDLAAVRDALKVVLAAHEPHPAVLFNRWWELVDANAGIASLLDGVEPRCSSRRSTCCGSRCTRAVWHRGSPTSGNGADTSRAARPAHRPHCRSELVELAADWLATRRRGRARVPDRRRAPAAAGVADGELSLLDRRARRHRHDVTVEELTLEAFIRPRGDGAVMRGLSAARVDATDDSRPTDSG